MREEEDKRERERKRTVRKLRETDRGVTAFS